MDNELLKILDEIRSYVNQTADKVIEENQSLVFGKPPAYDEKTKTKYRGSSPSFEILSKYARLR